MTEQTKQEIFDAVVSHLREQNAKSIRSVKYWDRKEEQIDCAIRGSDDRKDPLGAIISDEEYDPGMEGYISSSLLDLLPERLLLHVDIIDRAMFIHDHCLVSQWEDEFAALASEFSLIFAKA
jgi:hypothetical protein